MKLRSSYKVAGSLLILLLVVSLATPFVVKSQLKKWMLENGAEEVQIERLYLNIWTGRLELQGLSAQANNRDPLTLGLLESEVSYQALWKKRLQVNALKLQNSQIPVHQNKEGWNVGPLHFAVTSEDNTEKPTSNNWHWGLSQLDIQNLQVDATLPDQQHQLIIENSQLRLLYNWLPDQNSFFIISGQLNKSPFSIDSQGTPLAKSAGGELSLNIEKLDLHSLLRAWIPELKGSLSSNLKLTVAQSESGLSLSQSGTLEVAAAQLKQTELQLDSNRIHWQGDTRLNLDGQTLKTIAADGELSLDALKVKQPELDLAVDSINWKGKRQLGFEKGELASTQLEGDLAIKALKLVQNQLTLNTKKILWQGANNLKFQQQRPQQIKSDGQLALDSVHLQQAQLDLQSEQINWQGTNQLELAEQTLSNLLNDGQLAIKSLAVKQPGITMNESGINWQGTISGAPDKELNAKGIFKTSPSQMDLGALLLSSQSRFWQGSAGLDLTNGSLASLSGTAKLEQIEIQSKDKTPLAKVAAISAYSLSSGANNQVGIGQLSLDKINLSHKKPLLSLAKVVIDKALLAPGSAQIDTIQLAALETELNLDKEGQPAAWLAWQSALTGQQPSDQPATPNTKDRTPFQFSLKSFSTTAPAKILFSDESVNAKDIEILVEKLAISNIDTNSSDPGPFELLAKLNRFGELAMGGNYSWMSPTPNGDWKGALSNLELPPFSPYMQRHSGYQIKSGQFNITTGGTVKAGNVDSKNTVKIENLDINQAKESDTDGFNKKLGMPLETAISILTDDDNNVSLDIPISGSVDDPEFGYQSVVKILMAKAAKEGAISYLTTALQPYGALISLGRLVAKSASKNAVDLEPISFEPGSSILSAKAQDYLGKIGDLLKKKEGIRLNLCGYAVASDQQAIIGAFKQASGKTASGAASSVQMPEKQLKEALNTLALKRSENVKQQLLDVAKVKADRLFSCLPEVDLKSDLAPRVGLGL
ncbi:MAG: DUF748 domain-containing protein [Motiliproteus sp.]|nr:DUF748 domain-containing protein [Motiliproteus sp.]MCW9051333.1 DUF748 domain-containing protein [Motiliproteus sp.]